MKESKLFKKVLEESLPGQAEMKERIVGGLASGRHEREVVFKMNKVKYIAIGLSVACVLTGGAMFGVEAYQFSKADSYLTDLGVDTGSLSRKDVKHVYKDISSEDFKYPATYDALVHTASEMGIDEIPTDSKAVFEAILLYDRLNGTARVTSNQIRELPAGLTYEEIIRRLGPSKDIGSGLYVVIYAVDGNKVLYLSFGNPSEICAKSGAELLEGLADASQQSGNDTVIDGTFISGSGNSIRISCPNHQQFDELEVHISADTKIVFADGRSASVADIRGNLTVTIGPEVMESYPPQARGLEIVINE